MKAKIIGSEVVHEGWSTMRTVDLRMPDGSVVERHLEEHGDGSAVLVYDPERRVALMVSLPRAPIVEAGEPDMLEAIAGIVEDEAPETTALRESFEEAGVRLSDLEPVGRVWPMASVSKERVWLYLAAFTQSDRTAEGGGAEGEHENITVHEIPLKELWRKAEALELSDMKTLLLVQALRIRRPELFA